MVIKGFMKFQIMKKGGGKEGPALPVSGGTANILRMNFFTQGGLSMKKLFGSLMAVLFVLAIVASPVMADIEDLIGDYCCPSVGILSVDGGASVTMQRFNGNSHNETTSVVGTNVSSTDTYTNFKGVGVGSNAYGNATLVNFGYSNLSGSGHFTAESEGCMRLNANYGGIRGNYSTSSTVHINCRPVGWYCCPSIGVLSIDGGAGVTMQKFNGVSKSDTLSLVGANFSDTYTHTNFKGVGVASNAYGNATVANCGYRCLSGSGYFNANSTGAMNLKGNGGYVSGTYSTSSTVHITAY